MKKFIDWHLYTGCDVFTVFEYKLNLIGVVGEYWYLHDKKGIQYDTTAISEDVRLILRRLDSMTYEERDKYGEILYEPDNDRGAFEIMDSGKHIKANTYEDESWSYVKITNVSQLINQLRKDGFDCDGLIESGQAIDAVTLNQDAGK